MSFYTDFPKYPTAIFNDTDYPNQTDDVNTVYAALVNALKEELQACFDELGTLPKGYHASVKARIEALEAQLKVVLDYMEYATDDSAQAAYVSSGGTIGVELYNSSLFSDANLEGYWRLEADGTDSSNNGYNVAAGTVPSYVSGRFGNGADFEKNSSQFLTIADASCANLEITGSHTFGAWIKAESYTGGADACILGKRDSSSGNINDLYLSGANSSAPVVMFRLTGLTTNSQVISSGALTMGTWYFVVGVYDSSNEKLKVWINDTKTEVAASGSSTDTNGDFSIGRLGGSTANYQDGIIDDAFVFSRALTDAEVLTLYNYNLQCYSESTIKEQGTYSLKVIGTTGCVDDTLTKALDLVQDLTGKTKIVLWARSDRIGENFKVEYRDSGGETISYTIEILIADTWEEKEIDISAVADADKDSIDQIKYTILNADAAIEFYLDNNYSN